MGNRPSTQKFEINRNSYPVSSVYIYEISILSCEISAAKISHFTESYLDLPARYKD